VLAAVRVVVDNGSSDDRLEYGRHDADGAPITETVIAIGGGTLSRGLTLEGLVVSYFIRTANTYDTLLQMGRWFGYRPGYEDLPRIWMPADLENDFAFLALIEEEMRRDMRRLEQMAVTPKEFGLRIRAHPGRLSITATNKMVHAEVVQVSYSGQRHQTIVLHEADTEALRHNIALTRELVTTCLSQCLMGEAKPTRTQFFGLAADEVIRFLSAFRFHPDQPGLRSDHIVGWIRRAVPESRWNVVVLGSDRALKGPNGEEVNLGTLEIGLPAPLPLVNRSPLTQPDNGVANIKALLSQHDWVADFDSELVADLRKSGEKHEYIRRTQSDSDTGMIVIYGVSKESVPVRTRTNARRRMRAQEHAIGLGLFFPWTAGGEMPGSADYYSVRPDWDAVLDEDIEMPEDREGSATLDGDTVTGAFNG
jgi:hypothetical protein